MFNARQAITAVLMALTACFAQANAATAQEAAASPRENLMKTCGDKWRAVREAETANGVAWPQFLSRCRAAAAGESAAAPSPAEKPARSAKATQAAPQGSGGSLVFPQEVSPRHAGERPALARQRTCAEQFKANKASGANGGLRWIEKGGGYWSKCNAHLKQLRA